MDFGQGKIYKIIDETNGDVYVGSTVQILWDRFQTHGMFETYHKIKSNCKISLIEEYPCENKRELEEREQYWMNKFNCINKQRAFRDPEFHKTEAIKRAKEYYENNREKANERNKQNNILNNQRNTARKREVYYYQNSWGGEMRRENNLLLIDLDLFN
tara:strand:- start:46 stop:519 length:474 start_codon:yes stop_codon:yes gene_type:complete